MKFFGKNSLNPQTLNIPGMNPNQQAKFASLNNEPSIIDVNLPNFILPNTHKSSSVKLINYVEPFVISGVTYTLFYTEYDTKFLVGDRVFIVSGNYDSDQLIQQDPYTNSSDGYRVLFVDRTKVVLDIPYDGTIPYDEDDIDNFIKVYVAHTQDDFDYFIQTTSTRDFPYLVNRFANIGTFSTNNFLYIDGTFSVTGDSYGILGFTSSGSSYLTFSNSFLVLSGTTSGYLEDITIRVTSGNFSRYLSANLYTNRNLYIMNESFRLPSGTEYRRGSNYRFCEVCSDWRVNVNYRQPFITRLNFRGGNFASGQFNQGLIGSHLLRVNHVSSSNVEFNLGTILNTNWQGGSISDGELNGQSPQNTFSFITKLQDGFPFISQLRRINNDEFGYNFIYESDLTDVVIEQASIFDSILGTSTNTIVYEFLMGLTPSYDVTINGKSQIFNSKLLKTFTRNLADFYSSQIINSRVLRARSINSEFEKSVFEKSRFISDKIIKLDNYDERNITWWEQGTQQTFKLYKFYVSEDKFKRLVETQNFYFDGIKINKPNLDILNFFDDKFSFDAYKSSYDTITGKNLKKVIVQLSTAAENLRTIDNSDITYSNTLLDNEKEATPSIDIMISPGEDFNTFEDQVGEDIYLYDLTSFGYSGNWGSTESVFGIEVDAVTSTFSSYLTYSSIYDGLVLLNNGTWTHSGPNFQVQGESVYSEIYMEDVDGKIYSVSPQQNIIDVVAQNNNVLDIDRSFIIDSDFKSGLFVNSTWISGNYMNYNLDHTLEVQNDYIQASVNNSTGQITLGLGSKNRRRLINENEVVFFNRLELDGSSIGYDNLVRLPDTYRVSQVNTSGNLFLLEDILNGTNSVFYTFTQSVLSTSMLTTKFAENAYNYAHPVKFLNSKIQSGIFRRAYFVGTTFDNSQYQVNERDPLTTSYDGWRRLLVADSIFSDNSNIFENGTLLYSHWLAGSDDWRNGIVQNSIWNVESYTYSSGLSGSTTTVPINNFKNGIFRQSRWVNGVFSNGLFYKNNSNSVYTTQVYNDDTDAYYRKKNVLVQGKTRWAFLNGIFKNGTFERSHFENGLFEDGEFFNSTFLDGIVTGGLFGKSNLDFNLTRVGAGTFSNLRAIRANFYAENPTGQLDSYFNIEWLSGIFDSGVFGVRVVAASYSTEKLNYRFRSNWYDGTFNNGSFQDTAVWHYGEFNNGDFTSYYGYPFVTTTQYPTSPSQSFAWRGGYFNNGFFGTADLGTNSTWFTGQFNNGIFRGRYWQNGVFIKGLFEGSGNTPTVLSNVPNYVSNFSESYYGLWNDGYVNELPIGLFSDIEIFRSEIRELEVGRRSNLSAILRNVLWRAGTFSHGDGVMINSVWTGGVFESGNFQNSSFNPYLNYVVNGEFKLSTDQNNTAGSLDYWEKLYSDYYIESVDDLGNLELTQLNGNLYKENDGVFAKTLTFTGTSSYAKIYQTAGLTVGDSYKLRVKLKSNENCLIKFGSWSNILRNRNFSEGDLYWIIGLTASSTSSPVPSLIIATGSPGFATYTDSGSGDGRAYLIYPGVLQPGIEVNLKINTFNSTPVNYPFTIGSCDSSQVEISEKILLSDFVENVSASFSSAGTADTNIYTDNFVPVFNDLIIVIDSTSPGHTVCISGITLTNNRTLYSSNATQSQVIETSFTAEGGDFSIEFLPTYTTSPSAIQVYDTAITEINSIEVIEGQSGFNTSESCVWKGGRFINSEFYYSVWENGYWENGLAMGMIWKNGISKYMNAYNVYWEGGRWRNGNWNGSPWSIENLTTDGCIYSYELSTTPIQFENRNINYGAVAGELTAIDAVSTNSLGGVDLSSANNSGFENPESPAIDGNDSLQGSGSVYVDGYFFTKTLSPVMTVGKRYRITITLGRLEVQNQSNKDIAAIYFSVGKPNTQDNNWGEPNGSLKPNFADEATGDSSISFRYQITDLEDHVGQISPDLVTVGIDGYESNSPGTITEILEAKDDGRLYIHVDMFGVTQLNISGITIEEEICTQTAVVNSGFTRDILAHISDYRQSIGDTEYDTLHLNDVFIEKSDPSWPTFTGPIQQLRFTYSTSSATNWTFSTTYQEIMNPIQCFSGVSLLVFSSLSPQTINTPNYTVTTSASSKLYASVNNNMNIFSQSGDYRVTLKYICSLTVDSETSVGNGVVKFKIGIGHTELATVTNGGIFEQITESFRLLPLVKSCTSPFGGKYYGNSGIKTLEFTFSPTGFVDYSPITQDTYRFYVQKVGGGSQNAKLRILYLKIEYLSTQYSKQYNNKLYTTFDSTPEIGDILALPSKEIIGGETYSVAYSGSTNTGIPISIRFGNGVFTSGTASAFSSVWENGVWNEGWRYDRNVIYFTNFSNFNNVGRPLVYAGAIQTSKVKAGEVANEFDQNLTQLLPTQRIFTMALYRTPSKIYFDDGLFVNQDPTSDERQVGTNTLRQQLKVGDLVSVGNVVAIDVNGDRRLITEPFKVVDIISPTDTTQTTLDILYIQVTLNFDAKTIKRDSEQHLIYVTKNIWFTGAFLNGYFKGVWGSGLFKGRPYITKMKDSQWISGIFDGGHFQGKTLKYPLGADEDLATFSVPSGLIQYFRFKDNDLSEARYQHNYNSWIDVNYYTSSTVNIGENRTSYAEFDSDEVVNIVQNWPVAVGEYSDPNHFSSPTEDVLSSSSLIRGHSDTRIEKYFLGTKFKEATNYLIVEAGTVLQTPLSQVKGTALVADDINIGAFSKYYNTVGPPQPQSLKDSLGFGVKNFIDDGFTYSVIPQFTLDQGGICAYIGPPGYISNKSDSKNLLEIRPDANKNVKTSNDISFSIDILENSYITKNLKRYRYNYISFDYIERGDILLALSQKPQPQSILEDADVILNSRPTNSIKEYFYNRRGLDLNLLGFTTVSGGTASAKIDNLKFVETDMIPFFLLGTESRINQKVQTPLGAVAPFIDYGETEFAFLDLLEISETIFSPLQNPTVVVTPNNTVTYTTNEDIKGVGVGVSDFGIVGELTQGVSVGGGLSVFNPGTEQQKGGGISYQDSTSALEQLNSAKSTNGTEGLSD
jgi:hypothetical protein